MNFRPMLAADATLDDVKFPVLASPKLDGIRCVMLYGCALTRSLKPIPNRFVREWMEANVPTGWDGELMLPRRVDGTLPDFNEVQSAIMSLDGEPDFRFHVFDNYLQPFYFEQRWASLIESCCWQLAEERVVRVPHDYIKTQQQLEALAERHLQQGYEGTMVRHPNGRYKFGRSTLKQGLLLKLKPHIDEEATVVEVKELMRNHNEQERNELGLAKRSKSKEGLVPGGMLGSLVCRTDDGVVFEVGSGFTEEQRKELWTHATAHNLRGSRVTVKMQKPPGRTTREPGTAPRSPVFKGFRSVEEL